MIRTSLLPLPLTLRPPTSLDSDLDNMSLLWVSDPAVSANRVRAHVAKNTHAAARRERVARYQAGLHHPVSEQTASTSLPMDSRVFLASQLGVQGPISQFESFLVNYYVNAMIPYDGGSTNSPSHSRSATVLREWLPVALGDPLTQMGLYLCACRNLHARTGSSHFYQSALRYKAACLRLLAESIATAMQTSSTPLISDTTMSAVLQLASDEIVIGDTLAWSSHINAIGEMVRLCGGLDRVRGMNGFLRKVIEVLSREKALRRTCRSLPTSTPMASITLETLLM
ncbi:hypothetical protein F5Y17DRAFT_429254 [Xylariaceae sp. FL0594]|nr:hypothetical protein F5Y17DRAFT_429254 [Xylariaceae sp. FL0594]